jgi:hypothetical protein
MKRKLPAVFLSLGIAALARGATYFPIPLTPGSFTYDIVVEATSAPPGPASVNCTVDNSYAGSWGNTAVPPFTNAPGLATGATTLYEIGVDLAALTTGMPLHNSVITSATQVTHKFQMPPTYATNCAILIAPPMQTNAITSQGTSWVNTNYAVGSLTLTVPTPYTAISVLGLGGNSGLTTTMVISYNDGSSQTNTYASQDWVNVNTASGGQSNVFTCLGRVFPPGPFTNVSTVSVGRLWSADYTLSNTTASITNISWAFVPGTGVSSGRSSALIFGVSGSTDGVDFNPLGVTGFNADPVIEAQALPYTATMDFGTNINSGNGGVNTWFEIGWDPYRPNTGFPAHGSVLTSTNTGRQYQMASSYTGPMSTLVDTNHQLVNITPRAPSAYTAFSVLTAGASIQAPNTMSNILVLQHADGVNETNIFYVKDWFDNTVPAAFSALERANFSGSARYFNNIANTSGDPKIFESSFPMQDTTSPVTNIQVKYYNPSRLYNTNWTTYILAVSATVGGIPITLGTNTLAQNVYAGGTATFNVSLTFGTTPGFQWQYSATEYGSYANLTDGGGISGSQAASLVISGVSAGNAGFYQCIVTNGLSTNTTVGSPLTLLVSTASDISQPGDTITPFPTTTPSPTGEDSTKAIDGTLAKYLNSGNNGINTPFSGPVGYVTTPTAGSSIITAMRFFVASDVVERDPADYMLEGSNDGGNTYTVISSGGLSLADVRNENLTDPIDVKDQVMQEVDFANSSAYYSYRVTFMNAKTNSTATSIQVSEVQLLGVLAPLPPGIVKQPPASQQLYVGETFSVTIQANGPTPITYQWFDGPNPLPGKTNATLTLNNVQTTDSGSYTCLASNIYGGTTSSADALMVINGPPQILANGDLQTNYVFYAGSPMVLSVATTGSQPITYSWRYNGGANLANGGRTSGATSNTLTISPAQLGDMGTYQLFMSNSQGTAQSQLADVTVVPVVTFNGLGAGWSFNSNGVSANIGYVIGTNGVQLTDSTATESSSTFFTTPVYVGGFRATWAYEDVNLGGADGVTFCIQNDPRGAAALGTAGGGLGYGASQNPGTVISPSFALEFNLYTGQVPVGQPVGYAFNTNGTDGTYISTSPVSLNSGHLINVSLTYLNGTASMTLTDAVSATTFSTSANWNIPAVLGTNIAYVGFTGADGGVTSTQIISNFTFVSLIPLSVSRAGQNVILSWPIGSGGYQLQSNTAINSAGSWVNLTNIPVQVGANNQVTIAAAHGAVTFYRLVNP